MFECNKINPISITVKLSQLSWFVECVEVNLEYDSMKLSPSKSCVMTQVKNRLENKVNRIVLRHECHSDDLFPTKYIGFLESAKISPNPVLTKIPPL